MKALQKLIDTKYTNLTLAVLADIKMNTLQVLSVYDSYQYDEFYAKQSTLLLYARDFNDTCCAAYGLFHPYRNVLEHLRELHKLLQDMVSNLPESFFLENYSLKNNTKINSRMLFDYNNFQDEYESIVENNIKVFKNGLKAYETLRMSTEQQIEIMTEALRCEKSVINPSDTSFELLSWSDELVVSESVGFNNWRLYTSSVNKYTPKEAKGYEKYSDFVFTKHPEMFL